MQLLHELVSGATRFAMLQNPTNPVSQSANAEAQAAARTLGLQLLVLNASTESDFEPFRNLVQHRRRRCMSAPARSFRTATSRSWRWRRATGCRQSIQTMSGVAGGLMSYGSPRAENVRLAGNYTGRIQGRETGRPVGAAAHQSRAARQHKDRQGARPHHPDRSVGPRRRGDRIVPQRKKFGQRMTGWGQERRFEHDVGTAA